MRKERLESMVRGWFVGEFTPTAFSTEAAEVAVKEYAAGEYECAHYHKEATEVTVVLAGTVEMNGVRHVEGDILVIEPGERTDFLAVTPVTTLVVKVPCSRNDKYLFEEDRA